MASMRSASFEISHFDQAIKSSVSKLGDKRIYKRNNFPTKKSLTWFPLLSLIFASSWETSASREALGDLLWGNCIALCLGSNHKTRDGRPLLLTGRDFFAHLFYTACKIIPWEMRNYFQWRKKTKNIWRALILLLTIKSKKVWLTTTQDNCLLGFFHFITFMLPYFFATKPCQNHSYKSEDRVILLERWNR